MIRCGKRPEVFRCFLIDCFVMLIHFPCFFRFAVLGRLILRYPILAFQKIVDSFNGQDGWYTSTKKWTPKRMEQVLSDVKIMGERFDKAKQRFYSILFPKGFDKPTLRSVPIKFRAIHPGRQWCAVMPVKGATEARDGLFAIATLPAGTTWLLGGIRIFNSKVEESTIWNGIHIGPPRKWRDEYHGESEQWPLEDDGLIAWKCNEPDSVKSMNAVAISGIEGIYVTLFDEVKATPDDPVEILWYYDSGYQSERRKYMPSLNAKQLRELEAALGDASENYGIIAMQTLRMVDGVKPRVYK